MNLASSNRVHRLLILAFAVVISSVAFTLTSTNDKVLAEGGECFPTYYLDWVDDSAVLDCNPSEQFSDTKCNGTSYGVVKNGQNGNQFPFPMKSKKGFKQYCDPYGINVWEKRSKLNDDALTMCLSTDLSGPRTTDKARVKEFKKSFDYKECFKDAFIRLEREIRNLKIKPSASGSVTRACTTGNVAGEQYPQMFNALGCIYGFGAEVKTGEYKTKVLITIKSELHTKKMTGTSQKGESLSRILISMSSVG